MEGLTRARLRRLAASCLAGGMLLTMLPTAASGAPPRQAGPRALGPALLDECEAVAPAPAEPGSVVEPWQTLLDEDGVVSGHQLTLRWRGADLPVRTGRRGFAAEVAPGLLLVGERSDEGTSLTMLDTTRACQLWQREIEQLAYDVVPALDGTSVMLSAHEPVTRLFEGMLVLDVDTGATEALIDGECSEVCEPNDGEVPPAAYAPAGTARPVPVFSAGGWPRDQVLPFAWGSGSVPPTWARDPIRSAADDTRRTSDARTPLFGFHASADDTVRYTGAFPSFCRYGIACASRSLPSYWAVWIRPHGTDFSWGTLRWCQKQSNDGCFDLRRVMIHELGHVSGLNHPDSAGFRLGAHETVMHAITPAKPSPSSTRHAYGRCDVASLQELYDVLDRKTHVSTCNDVVTTLSLASSTASVPAGSSVRLTAELRIADRDGYGRLGGNGLDGRSVRLKYRRAGSDDAWSTAWMDPKAGVGLYELTIRPQATWEFEAVFPAPDDEGLRFSRSDVVKVKVTQ